MPAPPLPTRSPATGAQGPASGRSPRATQPPALRSRLAGPATLAATATLVVALDLALAIRPRVSLALTALELTLLLPWIATLTRREPPHAMPARGSEPSKRSSMGRFFLAGVPLALLLACLGAKWRVLGDVAVEGPAGYVALYRTYAGVAFVISVAGLVGLHRIERFLATMADHPARLMVLSFGLTALLGGLLLTLPQSLQRTTDGSLIDGVFTSVSAVCVTGLAVNNISTTYTLFGQVVIAILIQLGGLGIMVLSAFFAIVSGQRLRVRSAAVMAEMIDSDSLASLRRTVTSIVLFTLVIEAAGAGVLYQGFMEYEDVGLPPGASPLSGAGSHVWAAVFHSISAFCNAGFSLCRDGLVPLADSVTVSGAIMALIVLGGLGFPVLDELLGAAWTRVRGRRPPRLTLHARTVLLTTAVLVAGGTAAFLVLEWSATMRELSWPTRFLAAAFQSVTTRTAGFNTIDFGAVRPATLMMTCMLMFVGAGPGSTAGGIKITTLAVLYAALRAELRGHEPRLLQRALPAATVRRATGLAFLSVLIVMGVLFVLLLIEPHGPLQLAFETISAFATVGLSTGITASLTAPGKLIVAATMFAGRIGPLTLALALATRSEPAAFRLPEERVGIG